MEKKLSKRERLSAVQQTSIMIAGALGILVIGAAGPNAMQVIPKSFIDKLVGVDEKSLSRSRRRLVERGYLEYQKDSKGYVLTRKGEIFYEKLSGTGASKKRWDGKWRVLIFDISERYKAGRNRARTMLASFGLVRLQDSVWVYPYPCDEYIALLKAELRLGSNLLYLVAGEFEGEDYLLKAFKLKR